MSFRYLIFFVILSARCFGQENFGDVSISQTHYFGINLIPSINGDLYHFAEVEVISDNKFRYNTLTRREFILKASGLKSSKANPNKLDFFKQFNIKTDNPYWDPIENLWRLRFQGHPYDPNDYSGWYIPNPIYTIPDSLMYKNQQLVDTYLKSRRDSLIIAYQKQRKMLAEFGIEKFSDYALGEQAFKMIKAVQDKHWIESYINTSAPKPIQQLLRGEKPEYTSKTKEERRKETQVHNPFQDVTIQNVQRSGLDQLLHGVKGAKKTNEK